MGKKFISIISILLIAILMTTSALAVTSNSTSGYRNTLGGGKVHGSCSYTLYSNSASASASGYWSSYPTNYSYDYSTYAEAVLIYSDGTSREKEDENTNASSYASVSGPVSTDQYAFVIVEATVGSSYYEVCYLSSLTSK